MTFSQYKYSFEKEASNVGFSQTNIERCLVYANRLIDNGVPVIYNTSHLSSLVGYKKEYLKKAVFWTSYFYSEYRIKKKDGGIRTISEPLPSLKEIQTWILQNILQEVKISSFAKAYKKGVSIVENIKFHQNQKKVLTIDIENYFPSIKFDSVENIFQSLGYSVLVSNLLAKLCTKERCLPQGSPTSPYLSNIVFYPIDEAIAAFCKNKSIRYTRYADDLTFSGDFNEFEVLSFVTEQISQLGLSVNSKKVRVMYQGQRQSVTGVVVNRKLQVPFSKRNIIRQEVYYIRKFGLVKHMERKGIVKKNYLSHLLGKVNFVIQINPGDVEFVAYKEYLLKVKEDIQNRK